MSTTCKIVYTAMATEFFLPNSKPLEVVTGYIPQTRDDGTTYSDRDQTTLHTVILVVVAPVVVAPVVVAPVVVALVWLVSWLIRVLPDHM